ncbi:Ger(x)C family spore germination protein [Paenibacillus rigui]|uniref:Spore gernimation protein GerC n=1 Tax=Paenibacillus rigui TaxID=554312 RepID=A0A229UQW5_9BACL|nr:Ger(x)C family spore germination protein [Paenibacillus rigui]OXM85279.1 spore gernimation protein GerC [Paenibacillus rigui]
MKLRWILSFALLSMLLTGCWNRIELNELSITSATAFDLEGEDWVISYQVVIPSAISSGAGTVGGSSASRSPITVFSARGRTIREAVANSNIENSRALFFAHTNILVVSEQVARRGLDPIIDLYLRVAEARETVHVLVTTGKARTILQQLMHSEKIPGQGIREIIMNEARNSSLIPSVMLFELAMSLTSSSKSGLLPEIVLSGEAATDSLDTLKKTYVRSKLKIGRLGILKGDKLVGWMKREESFGVSFIKNKVNRAIISFPCGKSSYDGKRSAYNSSFRLSHSSTKLKPMKSGDHFSMKVDIKASGILMESGCQLDLSKPDNVSLLENQLQQELNRIVLSGWKASKELGTDVLGFADVIHRNFPKEWKKLNGHWDAAFARMEIEPQIKVSIDRTGLSNRSFKTLQNKED